MIVTLDILCTLENGIGENEMISLLPYKTVFNTVLDKNTWKPSNTQDKAIWSSKAERSFTDANNSISSVSLRLKNSLFVCCC